MAENAGAITVREQGSKRWQIAILCNQPRKEGSKLEARRQQDCKQKTKRKWRDKQERSTLAARRKQDSKIQAQTLARMAENAGAITLCEQVAYENYVINDYARNDERGRTPCAKRSPGLPEIEKTKKNFQVLIEWARRGTRRWA
ncbi:hypothetical protein E3N88_40074 [Mikania micrantha]|uniref:Uncharacterized protein n=1 Tax=Mikania micrantha TaxID=192012 RepID=A0A5N6LLQ8_9ASTR|nr:hypothetical protein E3N88_40074 [Mikania micrantha]